MFVKFVLTIYFVLIIFLISGCESDKTTNVEKFGSIHGTATDAVYSVPLVGVSISVSNIFFAETNSTGYYEINEIPPGNYYVKTLKPDFYSDSVSVLIEAGKDQLVDFNLQKLDSIQPDPTNITVPQLQYNNIIPNAVFTPATGNRIVVNLTGLVNPTTSQFIELFADYYGGNYNFYLQEDGILKGVKLTKISTGNILKADIVFTIDVSSSMGGEIDSIANSIIAFTNFLSSAGLDVQFGVVGYSGNIRGGINLTKSIDLQAYLNRSGSSGVFRAYGFAGADSAVLDINSSTYAINHNPDIEAGVVGILFADSLFNWRAGAQKIFINFTDDGNKPDNNYKWSVQNICDNFPGYATIHTVFSADTNLTWIPMSFEKPWTMSECTGGTSIITNSSASGLDLTSLPLSVALSNSYKVEFNSANTTGIHNVVITVKVTGADGKIEYLNLKYGG
jgi:hypothetical protein